MVKTSLKTWMGRSQLCKVHREECLLKMEQQVLRPKAAKKADVGGALWMSSRAEIQERCTVRRGLGDPEPGDHTKGSSFYVGAVEAIQAQGCLLLELSKEIHIIAHPLENLRWNLTLRIRASCPHLDHGSFAGILAYLQTDDRAFLWTGQSGGGCEECGRFVSPSGGDVFSERNCGA